MKERQADGCKLQRAEGNQHFQGTLWMVCLTTDEAVFTDTTQSGSGKTSVTSAETDNRRDQSAAGRRGLGSTRELPFLDFLDFFGPLIKIPSAPHELNPVHIMPQTVPTCESASKVSSFSPFHSGVDSETSRLLIMEASGAMTTWRKPLYN